MIKSQKALWIALFFTIVLGSVWQFYPLSNADTRLEHIAYIGPGFTSQDIPLNETEKKMFKNVGVVKRLYMINGQLFFLTVLDGTNNRHIVHDPAYCFRGGGWEIQKSEQFPLQNGAANLVEIKKGSEIKSALYWFSDGKNSFTSPWKYWWDATLRRISLGYSGDEPILIMIQPLIPGDKKIDWKQIMTTLQPLQSL